MLLLKRTNATRSCDLLVHSKLGSLFFFSNTLRLHILTSDSIRQHTSACVRIHMLCASTNTTDSVYSQLTSRRKLKGDDMTLDGASGTSRDRSKSTIATRDLRPVAKVCRGVAFGSSFDAYCITSRKCGHKHRHRHWRTDTTTTVTHSHTHSAVKMLLKKYLYFSERQTSRTKCCNIQYTCQKTRNAE